MVERLRESFVDLLGNCGAYPPFRVRIQTVRKPGNVRRRQRERIRIEHSVDLLILRSVLFQGTARPQPAFNGPDRSRRCASSAH
jgi:hypothetical protein